MKNKRVGDMCYYRGEERLMGSFWICLKTDTNVLRFHPDGSIFMVAVDVSGFKDGFVWVNDNE